MTYTEQIKSILEKSGVDTSALPDNLYSTLLNALLNAEMGGGGLTREEVEKIVTDEVAKIVAGAPEDFDTLKEMSDWISQHEDSAAAMNSAIQQNTTDISDNTSAIQTNANNIAKNETNISTLKKHMVGELTDSDFQEDSTAVMTKTVPTGMSDYAAISKIGGKTVKTKNLLKPQNGLKEATVNGITFTPVFDSNGHLEYVTANGTATANASFIVTKLTEDISGYILSLGLSQESVSYGVACELGVPPWTTYQTIKGSGEKTVPSITYTDTINVYVQVLKDTVANNVKFYPMLRKPGTSGIYEPYHEDLWNTPVESVVSTGDIWHDGKGRYSVNETGQIVIQYNVNWYIGSDNINKMTVYAGQKFKGHVEGTKTGSALFAGVWNSSNGFIGRFGVNSDGYIVIPEGGKYAKFYFYMDSAIADLTNITPILISDKTTLLIPDSDRTLPCFGYGIDETVQNIRDYENGTYTQMVAEIDLTSKEWARISDGQFYCAFDEVSTTKAQGYKGICSKYNVFVGIHSDTPDKSISIASLSFSSTKRLYLKDSSCKTIDDATNAMKGVKLVYELATPVVTDCSDMLIPIRVETGGTITLQNEHSLDVPNTVVYKKEVSLNG